jgi:hypothetical protein
VFNLEQIAIKPLVSISKSQGEPAMRSLDNCETDSQKHLTIRKLKYYKPEEYIDDYDYTLKKQWHAFWHDRERRRHPRT